MIEAEWWEFEDRAALAQQVADDIEFLIERAITGRGHALLAVTGGRMPEPVFRVLAKRKIDWPKVVLTLTDDRLVPAADPLSNFGLLTRMAGKTGAKLMPLVGDAPGDDPQAAGRAADQALAGLHWPPDLVWLGVGEDGHTASIFPGPDFNHATTGPAARRAVGVRPDPMPEEAPVARVTLTVPAIASAHAMIITVAGAAKRAILERAIEEGPSSTLPIGRVLAATEAALDIYWSEE